MVRRIPDFNAAKKAAAGQDGLFDAWRFHAFFTTADPDLLDTVTADTTHRGHAVIEQVNADLKASAVETQRRLDTSTLSTLSNQPDSTEVFTVLCDGTA